MSKPVLDKGVAVFEPDVYGNPTAVHYVVCRLRSSDAKEAYRATGKVPGCAVLTTWDNSSRKWLIWKDAKPVGLFGVDDSGDGVGIPWMVGTPEIEKIKMFIGKNSARYIEKMKEGFMKLANYVSVDNQLSIAWLKWCGFTIHPPIPYGPFGCLFHPFELRV